MIEQTKFEFIKKKYGHCASWAIWVNEGEKPKDNMGDLSIFDLKKNSDLLEQLNPDIILCGFNISRDIKYPFANFHGKGGGAYKIRYALRDTPFWGAYMTDIIKDFEEKASGKMMSYLKANKSFEEENVNIFRKEINDLGTNNPTIIAFGKDAHSVLIKNLKEEYRILEVPHYSNYASKEKYREQIKSMLLN